jgi:hypothetical protein
MRLPFSALRLLAIDLADADAVSPIHRPAAVAGKVEAVQPHHVDVIGPVGVAFLRGPSTKLRGDARRRRICIRPTLAARRPQEIAEAKDC